MAKRAPSTWLRVWLFIRNRYVLTTLGFLVWLTFFDKNDFLTTYSYQRKLNLLRAEKAYYEKEIAANTAYLQHLETNPANIERFAREKYLMKRANEDIFVVVKPEDSQSE